jgi:hypothetical protein
VNVPHPWALPIVKQETKFIMNETYVDHQAYEWEGSYAYSSIVRGFLHLQVGIISLPSLRSRHNYPSQFQFLGGKLINIRSPPNTIQIFCGMLYESEMHLKLESLLW